MTETFVEQIFSRHRFEVNRRTLSVVSASRLTPNMIRIVLTGADLAGFSSLAPDDHIKLFFPGEDGMARMRDYTPRAFDPTARTLTIDFALHSAGPATSWAVAARPGDTLTIGGPRGSAVVAPVFDWWLLIGDETALPAIGRRVEELPAGARVITLAAVPDLADRQDLMTAARHEAHWLVRPKAAANDPGPILAAARDLALPEGRGFVWIAAESTVARALRDHFIRDRNHPRSWMKAAGYWSLGIEDGSDKLLD